MSSAASGKYCANTVNPVSARGDVCSIPAGEGHNNSIGSEVSSLFVIKLVSK